MHKSYGCVENKIKRTYYFIKCIQNKILPHGISHHNGHIFFAQAGANKN